MNRTALWYDVGWTSIQKREDTRLYHHRKRLCGAALGLLLALMPAAAHAAGVPLAEGALTAQPAPSAQKAAKPYRIMVSLADQLVTVLTYDLQGNYTIPVRTFWCSTAREGKVTPIRSYTVGAKYRWITLVGGVQGQYAIRISGPYMIHSLPYLRRDPSTMMYTEYNNLGEPASAGCIRMQAADMKWIFENCAGGTGVEVVREGDWPVVYGGLGLAILPEDMLGWDPTDPELNNAFPGGVTAAPTATPAAP